MAKTKTITPLTGEALSKKVRELGSLSKEEKARACGYISFTKNGLERVNLLPFLNALMEAEGIELDGKGTGEGTGRGGRTASYRVGVQSNGNLLIGSAYTKQLGLKPGDEFEISLGRKHIKLKQVGTVDDESVQIEDWYNDKRRGDLALGVAYS